MVDNRRAAWAAISSHKLFKNKSFPTTQTLALLVPVRYQCRILPFLLPGPDAFQILVCLPVDSNLIKFLREFESIFKTS
jgi:hypothetical protein